MPITQALRLVVAMAVFALTACGSSGSSAGGTGGSSAGGSSAGGSSAGGSSAGGSSAGGSGGSGGEAGSPPDTPESKPGMGLTSNGNLSSSANFSLVLVGGNSPGNRTMASESYQLRGGLVGAMY